MTEALLYFAYGSNLHTPQMQSRCPGCVALQPAVLDDHRLAFAGLSRRWGGGAATIVPAPGRQVPGLLYRLSADDLRRLDGFEGCPTVYQRIAVDVTVRDGAGLRAFTYRKQNGAARPPSLRYFHQIWRGYKALRLDESALLQSVAEALEAPAPDGGEGAGAADGARRRKPSRTPTR